MAAACLAVATNVGDVVDMVAPENRPFIVPASDESAFSVALQKLANDTDGRAKIGSANQAKARSCFAEVDMIGAYAKLYAEPLASAAALMSRAGEVCADRTETCYMRTVACGAVSYFLVSRVC